MKKLILNNFFFLSWNLFNLVLIILKNIIFTKFLMSAFFNYISLFFIILNKFCYYFSRGKNNFWFKGFKSLNFQILKFFRIDCDMDLIYISILQLYKICCHTKYFFCDFNKII